jgi:hypothetical protein
MRSILSLLAIAALGFIVILQKKDAPEPILTKAKVAELQPAVRHNWMKHALDGAHTIAQNAAQPRKENHLP